MHTFKHASKLKRTSKDCSFVTTGMTAVLCLCPTEEPGPPHLQAVFQPMPKGTDFLFSLFFIFSEVRDQV